MLSGEKKHIVDVLFVLALFLVFALSGLVLVTLGANIYSNTIETMNYNYESRSAYSYLAEKVHQFNTKNNISIENFQGVDTLVFTENINQEEYATYLYFSEGYLYELFTKKDSNLGESLLLSGTPIMKLNSLDMNFLQNNLLSIQIETYLGESKNILVSILNN